MSTTERREEGREEGLHVQSRFFDPDQEMRALFGARAVSGGGKAQRWPANSIVRAREGWPVGIAVTGLEMVRGAREGVFKLLLNKNFKIYLLFVDF